MAPFESGSQYGAPRPVKAGIKYIPPLSETAFAESSEEAEFGII